MNKKLMVEQEVEKTFASFNRAERLKASPYLYTRIRAHLDEADSSDQAGSRAWHVLRPLFLAGIVAVNLMTVAIFLGKSDVSRQERVQAFAEAYALDSENDSLFGE